MDGAEVKLASASQPGIVHRTLSTVRAFRLSFSEKTLNTIESHLILSDDGMIEYPKIGRERWA